MYQYGNPVNDFYLNNARLPQYPQFPPQNIPQIKCFVVTSINEAKSAMIDPSCNNLFVDTSNGKIYLKKIGNNGQPQFIVYSIDEKVSADPMTEINNRLTKIENYIGRITDESVSSNERYEQSTRFSESAVAIKNEPNGTAEPTRLPEDAGNDIW